MTAMQRSIAENTGEMLELKQVMEQLLLGNSVGGGLRGEESGGSG